MIIDVHAHCIPAGYMAVLERQGAAPPPLTTGAFGANLCMSDSDADVAGRLEMMAHAGVNRQILSHGPFHPYRENVVDAVEAARTANDTYAELVRKSGGQLRGLVALPLPHIEASLEEIRYGLDELGMVGVTVNTTVNNVSIADERFDRIFAELDRRGAALFIHPAVNCLCSPLIRDFNLGALAPPLEDTVVAMQLVVRRIPIRFPGIKIIIAHLGGALPLLAERLDNQIPGAHSDLGQHPSAMLKLFWYDTVAHGSTRALQAACDAYGADRIVLGSDFPFQNRHGGYERTVDYIRTAGLSSDVVDRILEKNWAEIFGDQI